MLSHNFDLHHGLTAVVLLSNAREWAHEICSSISAPFPRCISFAVTPPRYAAKERHLMLAVPELMIPLQTSCTLNQDDHLSAEDQDEDQNRHPGNSLVRSMQDSRSNIHLYLLPEHEAHQVEGDTWMQEYWRII